MKYKGDQTSASNIKFNRYYTDEISATSITNNNNLKSSMSKFVFLLIYKYLTYKFRDLK